jgi:hypothetical protein
MWKRCGSGKPQQSAVARRSPSLVEQTERQAAVDRSICSCLLSSGSQVRVLPGASPRGRFGSGMSAIAAADGHFGRTVVEALWKRGASPWGEGESPSMPDRGPLLQDLPLRDPSLARRTHPRRRGGRGQPAATDQRRTARAAYSTSSAKSRRPCGAATSLPRVRCGTRTR